MAWTGVTCLALFINSIVWNGNTINRAPVWCDISQSMCTLYRFTVHPILSFSPLRRHWHRYSCGVPLYCSTPLPNRGRQECHNHQSRGMLYAVRLTTVWIATYIHSKIRRSIIIDLAIGLGLPMLGMSLRM